LLYSRRILRAAPPLVNVDVSKIRSPDANKLDGVSIVWSHRNPQDERSIFAVDQEAMADSVGTRGRHAVEYDSQDGVKPRLHSIIEHEV
jgi:hypothetical protein